MVSELHLPTRCFYGFALSKGRHEIQMERLFRHYSFTLGKSEKSLNWPTGRHPVS